VRGCVANEWTFTLQPATSYSFPAPHNVIALVRDSEGGFVEVI